MPFIAKVELKSLWGLINFSKAIMNKISFAILFAITMTFSFECKTHVIGSLVDQYFLLFLYIHAIFSKKENYTFFLFVLCLHININSTRKCNSDKIRINIFECNANNFFCSICWYEEEKFSEMNIEKIRKIQVMRNSMKFLRICYLFPTEYEINDPEKNVYIRYTMMNVVGSYFPIGIMLHLINNIKSKYFVHFYFKCCAECCAVSSYRGIVDELD